MKGDFSRDTFDASKHFSRVLMQQGRVQLDADWNEQTAIVMHYLRALARDLIGPHGGPDEGFTIEVKDGTDFTIKPGRYYADGILCECGTDDGKSWTFTKQPDFRLPDWKWGDSAHYLVYLDVWERHVTFVENDSESAPGIREVALGGPDTATRSKVVWQVKVQELKDEQSIPYDNNGPIIGSAIGKEVVDDVGRWEAVTKYFWQPEHRGQLRARAKKDIKTDPNDPCTIDPEAKYRGHENQLYRVEVYREGKAWDGHSANQKDAATFKWSRENGSVIFPVVDGQPGGTKFKVEGLNRDPRLGLNVNDWVEFVDEDGDLNGTPRPLRKVTEIEPIDNQVTVDSPPGQSAAYDPKQKHAFLRRWEGFASITEGTKEANWLSLEDGVQIQFQPSTGSANANPNVYRAGDYWLIPARTVTGDVEWPGSVENPDPLPPHGVDHHYAPLAIIETDDDSKLKTPEPCRRTIKHCLKP